MLDGDLYEMLYEGTHLPRLKNITGRNNTALKALGKHYWRRIRIRCIIYSWVKTEGEMPSTLLYKYSICTSSLSSTRLVYPAL